MKKIIVVAIASLFSLNAFSQLMHVKKYNFYSFGQDKKMDVTLLNKHSSAEAKKHPEYGVLPFNAQCNDCVELIEQRTATSRQFIKVDNDRHTMSQQGYFPLHYKKSENDIWRTIDPRLRPDANNPDVYVAANQPVPTKCDLNRKITTLNENGFELECNKDLTMYFYDEDKAYTLPQKGDYSHYTIGEEGLQVKNMWPGIDMQQIFSVGEVETNYIIRAPLKLPINKGFLVIEDHFTLPEGMTVVEDYPDRKEDATGYYRGDYMIKDKDGKTLFTYRKPTYRDLAAYAMTGTYKLIKNGNDYTMQVLVPVSWLTNKENIYPITIDPIIFGQTKEGNYVFTNFPSADLAYTTAPDFCDYQMNVDVPGESQLTDVYASIEYELTHDDACADATHDCYFNEVNMELVSDSCHVTTGPLSCDTAFNPGADSIQWHGTLCTTDSDSITAPLGGPIHVNEYWPNFIACISPSCGFYSIPFTLKNQDAQCGDVCGYLCARGNMWQMTVYAVQVEGSIASTDSLLCSGQADTLTAYPDGGVPPYHYAWSTDGGNTYVTVYNTPVYVFSPTQTTQVICKIYDTCGLYDSSNRLTVTILNTPNANAGPGQYLCDGGIVTLGGNPTTSTPNTSIQWAGENDTVQAYLSSTTVANPMATIPEGTVDSFYYTVTVSNASCFAIDTVWIISDTPTANAGPNQHLCGGGIVTLGGNVTNPTNSPPGATIQWTGENDTVQAFLSSTTAANPTITVPQGTIGSFYYTLTVTNSSCFAIDTVWIILDTTPSANAGPNQYLCEGGTVSLGGNPTTSSQNTTIQWAGENDTVQAYLSSTTVSNPAIRVPQGAVDSFYYTVTVSNSSCFAVDTVWIYSLADMQPVIQKQGNNLTVTSSGVQTYQWYLNDTLLPGDTTDSIQITRPGSYTVQVGLCGVSAPYVITDINDLNSDDNSISIIPNPSDGNFEIKFTSNENAAQATLKILDNTARLISTRAVSVLSGENVYAFHPDNKLAAGEYWLEIAIGKTILNKKFIVL